MKHSEVSNCDEAVQTDSCSSHIATAQHSWAWKGPLEALGPPSQPKQGHLEQAAPSHARIASRDIQVIIPAVPNLESPDNPWKLH